jgi:heat-inducible transcriptional repressor
MLDERKANILRAVVEEYIETAQPVGSGHVARVHGVNVSSATVRNDMAQLEHDGYLVQPHTSAGRVPTEKGYRFFVDHLGGPARLGAADAQQVRAFFSRAHGELEQMLSDTSRLLAQLTSYAAVVVGPPHEDATIRSVQVVGLAPRVALLVVVLSDGAVEKRTLEFDHDVDEVRLSAAATTLATAIVGRSPSTLSEPVLLELGPPDAVAAAALRSLLAPAEEPEGEVYTAGTAAVAGAFDAVGQVREILAVLEQQYLVVTLLRDVLDRGLNVAIGTETGLEPLADCSVIVAPYTVDGEEQGTIGVLGPTRMNYSQALASVAVVSTRLGKRLSEG